MKIVEHPAKAMRDEIAQLKKRQEQLESTVQALAAILYSRQRKESKLLGLLDRIISLMKHEDGK